MTHPQITDMGKRIKWKSFNFSSQVVRGVLLVTIGTLIGAFLFSNPVDRSSYLINLYTSVISIAVTVFVIDLLNRRASDLEKKNDLILQMSSPSNDFALESVRVLRNKKWLLDGSLRGSDFSGANLTKANLTDADLQRTKLDNANFQGANLMNANLMNSSLVRADLRGAFLVGVNFSGADLLSADLSGAVLVWTNKYSYQHMKFVTYYDAVFDTQTILPDNKHWTPETDLAKFGITIEEVTEI